MANLSNVTGPVSYSWSPAPVATEFSTSIVPLTHLLDGSAFVAAHPKNGVWPAGVVLTASANYPGTFTPPTVSPTGLAEARFQFTPNGPGSGTFSITASGAGITSVPTPTPVQTGTFSGVPGSGTAGSALVSITFTTSNIATPYAALVTNAATVGQVVGSALIGSAVALLGASGTVPTLTPGAACTIHLALLDGPTGKVITRSNAITVAAAAVAVTSIALASVASITANSPVETVVGTLSAQTSGGSLVNPILSLVSTAGGDFKLVGSQVRFAVGNVPQGSFVIRARVTSDNATTFEQDLAITVAAATGSATQGNGSVTLTGMPSTIVAGQLLSGVTYTATDRFFVLYRVAGAVEEGARFASGVMPGNLTLLVPQTAGAYTVRVYDAAAGGTLVFESTQMSVTAAPGPLPAQVTQTADTGVTQTGLTMNWSGTGTSYRFLARPGVGSAYGSLVDTTVSTNSYTFTGLAAGSSPRGIVVPQNANGFGPPSGQLLSFTSS